MNNEPDFFNVLKKNHYKSTPPPQKSKEIYFKIDFDEAGAFLEIVDLIGKPVLIAYESYHGKIRDILKMINKIEEKESFTINWNEKNDRLYLKNYEYLIWHLKDSDRLVNGLMEKIVFESGQIGEISYLIMPENNLINCRIVYKTENEYHNDFKFISEDFILFKNTVIQIQPVGDNFHLAGFFNSQILPIQLEDCLSLFFTHFDNIKVKYDDYKVITGEDIFSKPTIVFEEIGADDSLYFSVFPGMPGKNSRFFEEYEISKISFINELEKSIIVSNFILESVQSALHHLEKTLKTLQKQIKENNQYFLNENLFIVDKNLTILFLEKELSNLMKDFQVIGSDKLKKYNIRHCIPKVNFTFSMGTDFYLEGDAEVELEGNKYALFQLLNQYQQNSFILLSDGTKAIIDNSYIRKLSRLFKKNKDKVRLSFFDTPFIEELITQNLDNTTFKKSQDIFAGFNDIEKEEVNYANIHGTLRNYQIQGLKWLHYLAKHFFGGCLADDMGLGKTVQAIALLSNFYPQTEKPSLIIMPRTLLFNWEKEIEKFCPALKTYIYHGTTRCLDKMKEAQVILTTYGTVRNDIKKLSGIDFFYVILDESQNIKNLASQTNKSVMVLKNEHRLALSGTPLENNLDELFALFRFLNPAMFHSLNDFHVNYAYPIQKEEDKSAMQELKMKIYPFILRRLKQEVLSDLPEKIEQIIYVDMTEDQRLLYEQKRRYYYNEITAYLNAQGINKSQFFILQALTELRQIASIPESKSNFLIKSPKREVLMENLMEAIANHHKILVFANYLDAVEAISEDLKENHIQYRVMTGATQNREQLIREFQENDEIKVFLLTLKTGGVGLNLTASDRVFIFDPWWNKSVENQAIDRVHRIGQKNTVFSYKFITRGTIEEKILILQEKKSELLNNLIASDGAAIKTLSEAEIDYIFGV